MRARTMKEATDDGTMFTLSRVEGRQGELTYPAAETIEEALQMAANPRFGFGSGVVVKVERNLPNSRIGCAFVEDVPGRFVTPSEPEPDATVNFDSVHLGVTTFSEALKAAHLLAKTHGDNAVVTQGAGGYQAHTEAAYRAEDDRDWPLIKVFTTGQEEWNHD